MPECHPFPCKWTQSVSVRVARNNGTAVCVYQMESHFTTNFVHISPMINGNYLSPSFSVIRSYGQDTTIIISIRRLATTACGVEAYLTKLHSLIPGCDTINTFYWTVSVTNRPNNLVSIEPFNHLQSRTWIQLFDCVMWQVNLLPDHRRPSIFLSYRFSKHCSCRNDLWSLRVGRMAHRNTQNSRSLHIISIFSHTLRSSAYRKYSA